MRKHVPKNTPHEEEKRDAANTEALSASLPLIKKAEEMEEEPLRYASPPCYLAEFSDAECSEHAAK